MIDMRADNTDDERSDCLTPWTTSWVAVADDGYAMLDARHLSDLNVSRCDACVKEVLCIYSERLGNCLQLKGCDAVSEAPPHPLSTNDHNTLLAFLRRLVHSDNDGKWCGDAINGLECRRIYRYCYRTIMVSYVKLRIHLIQVVTTVVGVGAVPTAIWSPFTVSPSVVVNHQQQLFTLLHALWASHSEFISVFRGVYDVLNRGNYLESDDIDEWHDSMEIACLTEVCKNAFMVTVLDICESIAVSLSASSEWMPSARSLLHSIIVGIASREDTMENGETSKVVVSYMNAVFGVKESMIEAGGADISGVQVSLPEATSDDVTCPICLNIFYNPVLSLPCNHSFCQLCAGEMMISGTRKCGICRITINGFTTNDSLAHVITQQYSSEFYRREMEEIVLNSERRSRAQARLLHSRRKLCDLLMLDVDDAARGLADVDRRQSTVWRLIIVIILIGLLTLNSVFGGGLGFGMVRQPIMKNNNLASRLPVYETHDP